MKALILPGALLALALGLLTAAPPARAARLVVWMVGDDKTLMWPSRCATCPGPTP